MDVLTISKREKEDVYCYVKDNHSGGTVGVDSATFEVFDTDGTSVQGSGAATIGDDDTATPDIYGRVDCTASGLTADEYYEVRFIVTFDDGQVLEYVRHFKCVEGK